MKKWIKEFGNVKRDVIDIWLKPNINAEIFRDWSSIKYEDFVIVSKDDNTIEKANFYEYKIVIYEEVFEWITYSIMDNFDKNYDYYWLKNSLRNAYDKRTVITGSSYGLFGMDFSQLTDEINLSLPSQDMFYTTKGIYEVAKNNANIKNIILCCGYYYFFSDLSRTKNKGGLSRISKVYEPLSWGRHNGFIIPAQENTLYDSEIFDVDKIADLYSMGEWEKGYFTPERPREITVTKKWTDLSEEEKIISCERRAAVHNREINRTGSLKENIRIFHELVSFCKDNNINLYMVVTPVTNYYYNNLNKRFKEIFYSVLNDEEYDINVLDFISDANDMFSDEDFIDTDHLSEIGARKFTNIILQAVNE